MKYDPQKHHRRSIRLKGYDYTQPAAYFITICTHQREYLLGEVRDGEMLLNECGKIVQNVWDGLPNHYPNVMLDAFCIMPNHVHGIIVLVDLFAADGRGGFETRPYDTNTRPYQTSINNTRPHDTNTRPYDGTGGFETRPYDTPGNPSHHTPKIHGLPEIVRALKTFSSRQINQFLDSTGVPIWQRNYYEHIIRNERELHAIRQYILANPLNWSSDQDHPINYKPNLNPKAQP